MGFRKKTTSRIKSAASGGSDALSTTRSYMTTQKTKEKVMDTLKIVFVATPPIATVIYLSILMITQVTNSLRTTNTLSTFLNQSQLINDLITALQRERGMTCSYLAGKQFRGDNADDLRNMVFVYRNDSDKIMTQMEPLWQELIVADAQSSMQDFEEFNIALTVYRAAAINYEKTCSENLQFYTPKVDVLIYNEGRVFYDSEEGKFWGAFDALRMILVAGEMLGLKRATGGSFFAQGYLTDTMYRYFVEISGAADRYLELAGMADDEVKQLISSSQEESKEISSYIDSMMVEILANKTEIDSELGAMIWFANMTVYMDGIVSSTRGRLNVKLSETLQSQLSVSRQTLYIAISSVCAAVCICVPITIYYSYQSNAMAKKIREKMSELAVEKRKSENLLYQMMPKQIVKELQAGQVIHPKTYSECTVYFSDIKGFTDICSMSTPLQVVDLLNYLYTSMDTVLDQYGVYKVETIGDAYMVVSGIPKVNGADHTNEICTMALHMLKEISTMTLPHRPQERLRMRIGCNTGPCAAGIVGLKMPRYCLFGDTVNTASRMESTGMPMRIQISESTRDHLAENHVQQGYVLPFRGECEVKGKGNMRTYWVQCKRSFPYKVDLTDPDPLHPPSKVFEKIEPMYAKMLREANM